MIESILTSIKKLLGIAEEYTNFDSDIVMYINSAFLDLKQLGVGPIDGFGIEDDGAVWTDFIDDQTDPGKRTLLSSAKTFIYLKTKLAFDPPIGQAVLKSYQDMLAEIEWRLNVEVETK